MKLTCLATIWLLAAATAGPAITKDHLVGHWRWTDTATTRSIEYIFRDDGTFTGSAKEKGETMAEFTGKWSVEGDALHYEYSGDTSGRAPVGAKDRDKLLEVTKEYYVIQARTGAKRKYVRVE